MLLGNMQPKDFLIYTCYIFSFYFAVVGKRTKSEEFDIFEPS